MTIAPQAPRLSFTSVDDAISAMRARGLRLSTPRRLVLQALFAAEGPVSAVYLADALTVDVASVYRNLEILERHGLVRHVHLGHGAGLYALAGQGEMEYLYCDSCARVTQLTPEQLDPLRQHLREAFGHEARFTHFAIVGLCAQCAAQPDAPARSAPDGAGDTIVQEDRHSHGDHIHSHPHADRHEHEHEHSPLRNDAPRS